VLTVLDWLVCRVVTSAASGSGGRGIGRRVVVFRVAESLKKTDRILNRCCGRRHCASGRFHALFRVTGFSEHCPEDLILNRENVCQQCQLMRSDEFVQCGSNLFFPCVPRIRVADHLAVSYAASMISVPSSTRDAVTRYRCRKVIVPEFALRGVIAAHSSGDTPSLKAPISPRVAA
jgi:hypothetical protein